MLGDGAGIECQRDRRSRHYFPTDVLLLTEQTSSATPA
jgi:hypothetical protein